MEFKEPLFFVNEYPVYHLSDKRKEEAARMQANGFVHDCYISDGIKNYYGESAINEDEYYQYYYKFNEETVRNGGEVFEILDTEDNKNELIGVMSFHSFLVWKTMQVDTPKQMAPLFEIGKGFSK